jgi:DNA-binding winged helix-turn-helix (wHTH) protein
MEKIRYQFDAFVLDPAERLLWRGDQIVEEIHTQEFDILVLFVKNAGHLVSRETLIQEIWGGRFVEEVTVSNAVSRLRQALKAGGNDYIKVVPKKGYRFVCPVVALEDVGRDKVDVKESTEIEAARILASDKNRQ